MLDPFASRKDLFNKNAELTARLQLAEHSAAQLRAERDKLVSENKRLKQIQTENETLKAQLNPLH